MGSCCSAGDLGLRAVLQPHDPPPLTPEVCTSPIDGCFAMHRARASSHTKQVCRRLDSYVYRLYELPMRCQRQRNLRVYVAHPNSALTITGSPRVRRPISDWVAQYRPFATGSFGSKDRGRERLAPSPPSEPGVQFSRDGLSSQLFPHRDWRANRWASDSVKRPRSAKKALGHWL